MFVLNFIIQLRHNTKPHQLNHEFKFQSAGGPSKTCHITRNQVGETICRDRRARDFNISSQRAHSQCGLSSRVPLLQLRACVIFTAQVIAIQLRSWPAGWASGKSDGRRSWRPPPTRMQPACHQSSNTPRRAPIGMGNVTTRVSQFNNGR